MIRRADTIIGASVQAKDGEIGSIDDVYFSDDNWSVRYLVVDTGTWLLERRVLISPQAAEDSPFSDGMLHLDLTKEQVENSPDIDLDKPVSRQNEAALHDYYAWNYYWLAVPTAAYGMSGVSGGATGAGVGAPVPVASPTRDKQAIREEREGTQGDPTLRSMNEVVGYHIAATDGEIGHVEDFFIDEAAWRIRYMMVDTHNWLPGRKVLVSPEWIDRVSWNESIVAVNVTRQQVEESPEFRPGANGILNRDYEAVLYKHYAMPRYWL